MMTMNQIERLVRKITELLGQPALEGQAAKLAQDYAEVTRAAHRRLEQCALMIQAGEDLQALQLAETPPPLLDLITMLSFRQAGEWRTYCQSHNLPATEPFYDRYVRLLNSTYGKGLASDHEYYRDYRRALMQDESERALSILRVIARLNPADQNSAQELQRLEAKALRERLEELRGVLDKGDPEATLALVAKLESSPLKIPPTHPIWQRAQVVRCQALLGQARALREREAWQEAEPLVEEIRALASHHALVFPSADADFFEALESWTAERHGAVVQEQGYQRALAGLLYQVQSLDAKRSANRAGAPEELQAEFEALAAKWREAERFGRPLEEELAGRCQAHCDWLKKQIDRARKRQTLKSTLAYAGAVAATIVAGWVGWDFYQQQHTADELARLQTRRKVKETQTLLAQIPSRLKSRSRVAGAISKASDFVAKETEIKGKFSAKLEKLNQLAQSGAAGDALGIAQQRADCGQAIPGLAPEYQPEAKAALEAFDQKWQKHLQALQPEYNKQFADKLMAAEKAAAERLNPANGVAAVKASLPEVAALAVGLGNLQGPQVVLDEGLVKRWRQLTNHVNEIQRAADQWTTLNAQVPHSWEEHVARLGQVSQSPFASPAEREALAELGRLDVSPLALLGALLLPQHRQGWATLTNLPAAEAAFMPAAPTAEERDVCSKLLKDPNMQDVNDYYLTKHPHAGNPAEDHHVFVRGKLEKNKFFQDSGLIYDWKKSPDTLRFEQQTLNSFDYVQADYKGSTKECQMFQAWGLAELVSADNSRYQRSILGLLDRVNQDVESTPPFRAYVTLRLWDIAQQRPLAWGLQWAPAAAAHVQKLMELGAQNLQSGDWMVSNRVARLREPLGRYFAQSRATWFERQAQFFYRLTRQACDAGFGFAGYVDAQGLPVLTQTNAARGEFWGWSNRTRSPALLFRRGDGNAACQKVEDPLPLSPLFTFRGDRRRVLEQAAKVTLYSPRNAEGELPPLFMGVEYE